MSLRLVTGSFGKSSLCRISSADAEESRRRSNRLRECVDYVRWHARRGSRRGGCWSSPTRTAKRRFAGIPGVEVAHFNAIAGLDAYRDVRLLMVVGRPLPRDTALHPLCGAFFRQSAGRLRPCPPRRAHARRHAAARYRCPRTTRPKRPKSLRAAICEDEVFQAIGRGRGVNRTAENPLEVHVLADVALPLVHDQVLAWETVAPDLVQRMLLAGIAVDSPADAAVLHPAPVRQRGAGEEGVRAARDLRDKTL